MKNRTTVYSSIRVFPAHWKPVVPIVGIEERAPPHLVCITKAEHPLGFRLGRAQDREQHGRQDRDNGDDHQ